MFHHPGSVLHVPVNVRSLPPKGVQIHFTADKREKAGLAAAHDLPAVLEFSAVFRLCPWKKQGVRVEGQIKARIEQQCSITAEPLQTSLDRHFEARFVRQNTSLAKSPGQEDSSEIFLDPEGEDIPEIFSGNEINVGALAEEFFELEIDRYPRRPGVSSAPAGSAEEDPAVKAENSRASGEKEEPSASPFAVLTHLKKH